MMVRGVDKTERLFLERLTDACRPATTGRLLRLLFQRFVRERGGDTENRSDLDEQFTALFEDYRWQLDEGPPAGGAVTPALLGLVAQRHLHNKSLGAHYTGADVTGYIVRSSVLPILLDR